MTEKTAVELTRLKRTGFNIAKKLIGIIIGSLLVAISFNALILPYDLLTGGAGGLALIGKYVFDLPVHIGFLLINIPIFFWGLKELDREFMLYSLIGTVVVIIALPFSKPFIPVPELDLFLAAVFSGILSGMGIGIVLKFGASTGGPDILSVIMKKKRNISVGAFAFYFNIFVLALSLCFFDLKILLYTVISMWAAGKATDVVVEGVSKNKSVMIISEKNDIISERIIKDLQRGVTCLEGYGAFSGNKKQVLNCVVNHFEIAKLKEIVDEIDEKAFMFVTETVEVAGRGFTIKLTD